jgi:archaellum component FlaC
MIDQALLLQILATVFGSGLGAWISLYLFRAQQQTAFNRAIDRLEDVKRQVATDSGSIASVQQNLEALRSSYEKLNAEVTGLADKVVREFNQQQQQFMKNIQTEFAQTVEKSKAGLELTLVKEIAPLVPSAQQQKAVIDKLMDLTGYAMLAMGKYQLQVVESQSNKALEQTSHRVSDTMKELRDNVKEVKKHLDDIPEGQALITKL